MTKEKINLKQERDKVDDYIITADITVLSAFIIILSIKKPGNNYITYGSIASLLGLTFSLLFSLWHKYRFPKRQLFYEREKEKLISTTSSDIADFANTFVIPKRQQAGENVPLTINNSANAEKSKKVIETYLENLNYQFKESHEKVFNKPLHERNARTKFYLDKLARTFRHGLFVIGIIFFFVIIILNLTMA